MIVIGYGTGRCGTKSLALFLNKQPGLRVTHEGLPLSWFPALCEPPYLKDGTGDVGYYWLQYAQKVLTTYGNAKAIHIWREEEQVVESFWAYLKDRKRYTQAPWKPYPFDHHEATKDAIATTVRRYMAIAGVLKERYRELIYTMHTDELNAPADLLDWLGIYNPDPTPVHVHKLEEKLAPMQNPRL